MEENDVILLIPKEDFKKICRCCLSLTPLGNIFEIMYEGIPLDNIFCSLFGTQLDPSDDLPKKICKTCVGEILRSYRFKKSYEASEAALLGVIEIKAETVDLEMNSEPLDCDFEELKQTQENENIIADSEENGTCNNATGSLEGAVTATQQKPKIFTCVCNEIFASKLEYRQHRELTSHRLPCNYTCEICGKVFTKHGLRQHSKTHDPIKRYSCDFCQQKFATSTTLRRHTMRHTGERRHLCEFCGKGFIQMEYLKVHRRIHTGEKPYVCSLCAKSFRDKLSCDVHMRSHKKQKYDSSRKRRTSRALSKAFVCEKCGRRCLGAGAYKRHLNNHGVGKEEVVEGDQHQCEICKKLYSSPLSLSVHMKSHGEKRFLCSECGKGFHLRSLLESHVLCHSGEKSLACKFCDKTFARQSSLQAHLYVHTGEKRYTCSFCSKKFRQSTHLTTHLRVHTGEKPYACKFCDKAFTHKHHLDVHIRKHTGEKPFKCDLCTNMLFYSSGSLRKHKLRKHQ